MNDPRARGLANVAIDKESNAHQWLGVMLKDTSGEKAKAVGEFLTDACGKLSTPAGYAAASTRRAAMLQTSGARYFEIKASGRVLLGLGDASVCETSLRLDRTWGVPFLPGSALKGCAARAARELFGGTWACGGEDYKELFGTMDGEDSWAGRVTFHDAWWTGESGALPIDLDVMTVHHAKYYQGKSAPLDTESPTPVSFLSARGTYLVALQAAPGDEAWVERASELLKAGLGDLGIGAKTAAGYGRFGSWKEKLSDAEVRCIDEKKKVDALEYSGPAHLAAQFQVLESAREHVEPDDLRLALLRLCEGNRKAILKWLRSDKRSETERAFLSMLEEPESPSMAEVKERDAVAWITDDRKRGHLVVCFEGEQEPWEKRRKNVKGIDLGFLDGSSEKTPFPVHVCIEGTQLHSITKRDPK